MKVGIDAELSRIELVMTSGSMPTTETINTYQARVLANALNELAGILERTEKQAAEQELPGGVAG